jgi:hypothetical protein
LHAALPIIRHHRRAHNLARGANWRIVQVGDCRGFGSLQADKAL